MDSIARNFESGQPDGTRCRFCGHDDMADLVQQSTVGSTGKAVTIQRCRNAASCALRRPVPEPTAGDLVAAMRPRRGGVRWGTGRAR